MDISAITGAYQGLNAAKEILGVVFDAKVDAEAKPKILEAMEKLGKAQDTLFELREELFNLQDANKNLKEELAEAKGWQTRADQYELAQAAGSAVVFKFKGEPAHFACPSCFNKKEIHILQDNRTLSGKYRCTGCGAEYPIKPHKPMAPLPPPVGSSWMA
ncbi:hypothetical protein [Ramlibacter sp.]|uniref:hypothetical protein n=1 Tax=Ramlibacter sp. TaxID=1917967 RepID=UPI002B6D907A|nr:hypothetical protein [Ramlibacter sp.]HWI80714.1 hypothetical protein [Ramlibacter sp.]